METATKHEERPAVYACVLVCTANVPPGVDVELHATEEAAIEAAIGHVRDFTEERDWDSLSVAAVREHFATHDSYSEGDNMVAIVVTDAVRS